MQLKEITQEETYRVLRLLGIALDTPINGGVSEIQVSLSKWERRKVVKILLKDWKDYIEPIFGKDLIKQAQTVLIIQTFVYRWRTT